jgi:hypothetical protein
LQLGRPLPGVLFKGFQDYSNIMFQPQEMITDVTEGKKRYIDILAEVKINGEDGRVLIHVNSRPIAKEISTVACSSISAASTKSTIKKTRSKKMEYPRFNFIRHKETDH